MLRNKVMAAMMTNDARLGDEVPEGQQRRPTLDEASSSM